MVRQEFIPGDVDEAEFEVNVTAPEGTSLAAMDEVMRAHRARRPGRARRAQLALSTVAGGSLGAVNTGRCFVRIAPHDERVFSLTRLAWGLLRLDPWRAFRGNYTQRDVMQQIRTRLRKYHDLRIAVRNLPSFNIGGGNFDIDFIIRGPELEALAGYTERLRAAGRRAGPAWTPTPRSS